MNRYCRIISCISIAILTVILLSTGAVLCYSRYHYRTGIIYLKTGQPEESYDSLKRSLGVFNWLKRFGYPLGRDLFRVRSALGEALYSCGKKQQSVDGYIAKLREGSMHLHDAYAYDQRNYRTVYWLAKTEAVLEAIWNTQKHDNRSNPFDGQYYFEEALTLLPTGFSARYNLIIYLYHKGEMAVLAEQVQKLVRYSPAAFKHVVNKPFFTNDTREKAIDGLVMAYENRVQPRTALVYLSQMAGEKGDYEKAASYYGEAVSYSIWLNSSNTFYHLGMLQLNASNFEAGNKAFAEALRRSSDFDGSLQRIYQLYKKQNKFDEFIEFTSFVEKELYWTKHLEVSKALCYLDQDKLDLAKSQLEALISNESHAKAYYLLARIARKQGLWDEMELAAQVATRLEPKNSRYLILFSLALAEQKKYSAAERFATKAIDSSSVPVFWYYGHRAKMRMELGETEKAIADWEKGVELKPDWDSYFHALAKAYLSEGKLQKALDSVNRAIQLNSENSEYRNLKNTIIFDK